MAICAPLGTSPQETFNNLSPCPGNIDLQDGRELEVQEWKTRGTSNDDMIGGIEVEIKGRIRLKTDNSLKNGNA